MSKHEHHPFIRFLEARGTTLRARLGLDELSPLDPFALARTFSDVHLFDLNNAQQSHPEQLEALQEFSASWSAMAFREGYGPWLITWNPWNQETRTRVSIVEELCHIFLKHKPTSFVRDPLLGVLTRTYEPSKEKQAYGVAGATVAPLNGLLRLLKQGARVPEIASQYQISTQLVEMRLRVTKTYQIISADNKNTTRAVQIIP